MKAILYIGHGTRSKKGTSEARAFVERVMKRVEVPVQEISFLELSEPSIEEGFRRCADKGATEITVVPLFLLAAGHIKQDIPRALSEGQAKFPDIQVSIKDPFGVQDKILDAIAELVRDSVGSIGHQDQALVVGRGSSDPGIQADFAMIANGIRERLGVKDVTVCYLAAAAPRLEEGFRRVLEKSEQEGSVIVIPYLLFSGLLTAEITQEIRKWMNAGRPIYNTGPLSSHQVIEDVVIERTAN